MKKVKNPKGNPNIALEGKIWRKNNPDWRTKTVSKTYNGKLRQSLNSRKYKDGSRLSRISFNSMIMREVLEGLARMEAEKEDESD